MDYSGEDNLQTMKLAKNYNRFLLNLALNEIRKNRAKNIMDFGAGTGIFAAEITENLGSGKVLLHRKSRQLAKILSKQ